MAKIPTLRPSLRTAKAEYHHLYNTRAWKRRRKDQLTAEPFCRLCGQAGHRTPATVADHIDPHRGDEDKFLNGDLQSLCGGCHSSVKQAEERTGMIRGADAAGMPADPQHPWNR